MLIRTVDLPPRDKPINLEEKVIQVNKVADELVNKALEDIGYSRDFVYRNYQNFCSILQDAEYSQDFNCEVAVIEIRYKGEPVLLFRRIVDLNAWKLSYDWDNLLPEGALIL